MHGDVLLDRAARVLVLGELLLRGGDALRARLEPRLERLLALGLVGELRRAASAVRVELLQGDESFEISIHECVRANKKGPAAAEPEVYSGCGPPRSRCAMSQHRASFGD